MSKNSHATSESECIDTQPVKLASRPFDGFDKTMKLSIVALYAVEGFFIILSIFDPDDFDAINLSLSASYFIVSYVLVIYLIRVMRGNIVVAKKANDSDRYLSLWGYCWRAYIIRVSSQTLIILCVIATGLWETVESPSRELTTIIVMFFAPTSVAVVWLFFSSDRKYQFQWLMTLIRGY